jgi:hypothetical protein
MHNLLSSVKWILIIVLILGWLLLCVANREITSDIVVIPGQLFHMPMSLILIFPFMVVFVALWVVGFIDQVDHFLQARELKKKIRDLESEVNQLRNLPIREGLASQRALEEENRS